MVRLTQHGFSSKVVEPHCQGGDEIAAMEELDVPEPSTVVRVFEGTGHNEGAWRQWLDIPLNSLPGRA